MKKINLITIPLAVVSLLFGGCASEYEQYQKEQALAIQKEADKLGLTVLEYNKQKEDERIKKEEREAYKKKMSNYQIVYATQPSGASLICEGKNFGYTPITLTYNFFDANSPITVNERKTVLSPITVNERKTQLCTAKWVSGFEKNYSQSWDIEKFPDGVQQTLQRPSGDGYKDDAEFGLKVETARYQQEQAQIAQIAAIMNANIQQRQVANFEEATRQQNQNQVIQNMNQLSRDINQNNQMRQQNFQLQQLNNNLMYKKW